jgi:tetratricopeptide (TPR) repeat protein
VRAALLLIALLPRAADADVITLVDGRRIEAEQAWYEGTEVRYRKDGLLLSLPREVVRSVESPGEPAVGLDPDLRRSRERLTANDPGEALRYARLALFRDPRSAAALLALGEAQLALGDPRRARESAERALELGPGEAAAHALLADALAALGGFARAEEEYRKSLALRDDPRVARRLESLLRILGPPAALHDARFRLRYDGDVNEAFGLAVLRLLNEAYDEYHVRLGYHPEPPVTVVLQTGTSFQGGTRAPEWAEGWNDGTIRVPVQGVEQANPRLARVLRHELAHSFVASRTGNNCPVWLHEGIAQWLEGGDLARSDAVLAPLARQGRLPALVTLEGPFRRLSQAEASTAYAQSLSAVAHILRLRGEPGLLRLLAALSDRLSSDEALPVALALSYDELQRSWERHLRAADAAPAPVDSGR